MATEAYPTDVTPIEPQEPTILGPYGKSILDRAHDLTLQLGQFGVSDFIQADIKRDLQDSNAEEFVKQVIHFTVQEGPKAFSDALSESLTPDMKDKLGSPEEPGKIAREWGLSTTMLSILLLPRYAGLLRGAFYEDWLKQVGSIPSLEADTKGKLERQSFYQEHAEIPRLLGGMSLQLLDGQLQQTGKGLEEESRKAVIRRVSAHFRAKAVIAAKKELTDEELGVQFGMALPVTDPKLIARYNLLLRPRS